MIENFYQQCQKIFWEEKRIFFPYVFAFIGFFLMMFLIWNKMPRVTLGGYETFPLHYNVHFGINYVGKWYEILFLPLGGFVLLIMNMMLTWFLYDRGSIFGYFLSFASLGIILILFVSIIFILLFNI